jgi:hypothetical protein
LKLPLNGFQLWEPGNYGNKGKRKRERLELAGIFSSEQVRSFALK